MAAVEFFNQDISFKLPRPRRTVQWIREVIGFEERQLDHLCFIFCSDAYLLSINEKYLKHKSLTDIITFDNSEESGSIEGDVFISLERVKSNAKQLGTDFDEEIHRVMIHGVLHLVGYSDKSGPQKLRMRKKEDAYLSLRKNR